jgi:hypothetical protein
MAVIIARSYIWKALQCLIIDIHRYCRLLLGSLRDLPSVPAGDFNAGEALKLSKLASAATDRHVLWYADAYVSE